MAGQLVVSNALCFLCSKYGMTDLDVLKAVFSEFYKYEEITDAKDRLLLDIKGMNLPDTVKIPHVPKRQGDNKHRVCDWVFKPRTADGVDSVPPVTTNLSSSSVLTVVAAEVHVSSAPSVVIDAGPDVTVLTQAVVDVATVVAPMDLTIADTSFAADFSTVTASELGDSVVQPPDEAAAAINNGD